MGNHSSLMTSICSECQHSLALHLLPPPSSKPRRKTPPKAKPADAHPAELNRQDSFEAFFGGELQPEPAAPAPAYNSNQTQPAGIQSHKPGVQITPPPPVIGDSSFEDF